MNKRDAADFNLLHFVCQRGARNIVSLLMENGTDTCTKSNDSTALLHMCARSGNKDIIRMLVDAGTDVNATDRNGETPLMRFASEGKSDAAQLLLGIGADLTPKDNEGHYAMDIAILKGLKSLITAPAGTNGTSTAIDSVGNMSLHQAC